MTHCDKEDKSHNQLEVYRIGIDTYQEPVVYMSENCAICRAEGFEAMSRVLLRHDGREIIATMNVVKSGLIPEGKAGLSESAWKLLGAREGQPVTLSHPAPLESMRHIHKKVWGETLNEEEIKSIISDVVAGRFSDVQLSSFITACAGNRLNVEEIIFLTRAMVDSGERLRWPSAIVADKHCVGGLPGNRTTPIVVSIVAACGLTIPKTSSRAITSPAGTADVMETMAPVNLGLNDMRRVVEKTGGCIVWGGSGRLSPADDILIRVEKPLDIDSEGQLVASVLSKKIAAGSTHAVFDIPVGPSAKVRSMESAARLKKILTNVASRLGLNCRAIITDGFQPIGRGIGPALEARDVLEVLRNKAGAPHDLRDRALLLAGEVFELTKTFEAGKGKAKASELLESGSAWKKFQEICEAQGGLKNPPEAKQKKEVCSDRAGRVLAIDNRVIARVAKLAGAPRDAAAGVDLRVKLGAKIDKGQPLFFICANSSGELQYALDYVASHANMISIGETE